MIQKPFPTYNGGKSGPGTYQTIINLIPPHKQSFFLFLGNGGIESQIAHCKHVVFNDIDNRIVDAWQKQNPNFHAQLWNLDALVILDKISNGWWVSEPENCFIYLDPPYLIDSRKSAKRLYKYEMTTGQHGKLLDILTRPFFVESGIKVMISCYPNEYYGNALEAWNKQVFTSQTRAGKALECLYYNYPAPVELHDYKFLGNDFRQREANNRIRNNIIKKLEVLPVHLRNSILNDIASHFSAILQPKFEDK